MNGRKIGKMLHFIGIFLLCESFFMLLSAAVAFFYGESDLLSFAVSVVLTASAGAVLALPTRRFSDEKPDRRSSFLLIVVSWIILAAFGAVPFMLTGVLPRFEDAFFESVSGLTTTGSTLIFDVESVSCGLLFWRALLQWAGGFVVIILFLALLPLLGMREITFLFVESKQYSSSKLLPRIIEIIRWLSGIYLLITIIEAVVYHFAGMSVFDAVCHAFSTISTGGFSTKNHNIAHWQSPVLESAVLFFMFFSGISFTLLFFAVRGRLLRIFRNEEFRCYLLFAVLFTLLLVGGLRLMRGMTFAESLRYSAFHVVSVMTTTGFYTQNYAIWPSSLWALLFMLMFVGASAGSPSGGVKVIRVALLLKSLRNEFFRFMHPNAILPLRFNRKLVPHSVLTNVFVFILLYVGMIVFGTFLLSCFDIKMEQAYELVLSAVSNVGYNFSTDVFGDNPMASLPVAAKYALGAFMLVGRIDLYIVIFLISRGFWKS